MNFCKMITNLVCDCTFPIDLAQNKILFGARKSFFFNILFIFIDRKIMYTIHNIELNFKNQAYIKS